MKDYLKAAFEQAAVENYWGDTDSVSGPGSNLIQTAVIRAKIPDLLEKYDIKTFLDAPCGDLFWMKEILPVITKKGIQYIGADIVPSLMESNRDTFKKFDPMFYNIDLTTDRVPVADMVLTRDCFIHLSYSNILAILKNYRKSGIKFVLTNTYISKQRKNFDVQGFYLYGRMLNMNKFPFFFPPPIELINENCTEGGGQYADKSLALWKLTDINLGMLQLNISLSIIIRKPISAMRKIRRLLLGK